MLAAILCKGRANVESCLPLLLRRSVYILKKETMKKSCAFVRKNPTQEAFPSLAKLQGSTFEIGCAHTHNRYNVRIYPRGQSLLGGSPIIRRRKRRLKRRRTASTLLKNEKKRPNRGSWLMQQQNRRRPISGLIKSLTRRF